MIDEVTAEELGASWRQGCPVAPGDLRALTVRHMDSGGNIATGRLIVHADWAAELGTVFEHLFQHGFPIDRIEPVSIYDADDDLSMAANNTSAFNCRTVAGTNRWSEHAYGRAVDINPLVNPWVRGSRVEPPGGSDYVDRDPSVPGLIVDGDVVVEAFASIGWGWGGHWSSTKDYQHFSATGR
jgi:poly-gamma-glutamate synthesis protein (capsule biosynthesis protein)